MEEDWLPVCFFRLLLGVRAAFVLAVEDFLPVALPLAAPWLFFGDFVGGGGGVGGGGENLAG